MILFIKRFIPRNIFFVLFTLIFLISGLLFLPINPLLLFLGFYFLYQVVSFFKDSSLYFPHQVIFFLALFLLFITASFIFSVDKINSFQYFLAYLLIPFFFVFGSKERVKIQRGLNFFFIFTGFVFIIFSIFYPILRFKFFSPYLQLIHPYYQNHNHLGDFLGLAMIYFIFLLFRRQWLLFNSITFLIFFVFFLISFSKSAYLSFILVFLILSLFKKPSSKIYLLFFICGIFVSVGFLLISSKTIVNLFNQQYSLSIFGKEFEARPITSQRLNYYTQALQGFLDRPFFGWGMNNFVYVSRKHADLEKNQVTTSLGFIFNLLSEIGFFGLLFFLGFIFSCLSLSKDKKNNPFFFLSFYLFFNFFSDYTYLILPLFFLFFTFLGASVSFKSEIDYLTARTLFNSFYLCTGVFILIVLNLYLFSQIAFFSKINHPLMSMFSFSHDVFKSSIEDLISQEEGEFSKDIKDLIGIYSQIGNYSLEKNQFLVNLASQSEMSEENKRFILEKTQDFLKDQKLIYLPFSFIKNVYKLKEEVEGKNRAQEFFAEYYSQIGSSKNFEVKIFRENIRQFCLQMELPFCQNLYFSLPAPNAREEFSFGNRKIVYRFNREGFNDLKNYSINKPEGVYRIVVIGDASGFGFMVDTRDNWTEILERRLNQLGRKVEVINLSYHGFDLIYSVERFFLQGRKYKPDLLIIIHNNFYLINEFFIPVYEKYRYLEQENDLKKKFNKEGKYFPSWEIAWKEYSKTINEAKIYEKQKKSLDRLFSFFKGKIILVSLHDIPSFFIDENRLETLEVLEIARNNLYYSDGVLTQEGHKIITKEIFSRILKFKNKIQ
ncbi:MAG: O-antigen ligase family protein [Patescibacteria group bacterium]|nr:O-antigen ligase family protein [Patescibacteria group bacterium]